MRICACTERMESAEILPGQNHSHVQTAGFEKFGEFFEAMKSSIWHENVLFIHSILNSVPK